MEKLYQIYNYILNYIKLGIDYIYPYLVKVHDFILYYVKAVYNYLEIHLGPYLIELYNYLYPLVLEHRELFSIIGLLILYLYIKSRRPKILRRKKFKKSKLANKKKFFNTGFRFEINFKDIIKIKIKLADYCDKKGCRYCYLFNIKLFSIEFLRVKYIDQKGQVYKRKVTFRS